MMIQENTIVSNLKYITENTLNRFHFKVHNAFNHSGFSNWNIHPRKIHDWMLVYARGGRGYYKINDTKHYIEEGQIFFISNDLFHSAMQEEAFPVSVIAIRFGLYDNNSNESIIGKFSSFGFSCKVRRFSYYQLLFENIYTYFKLYPEQLSSSLCHTLLCQVFNSLYLKFSQTIDNTNTNKRLEKVKLYIDENIFENMQLDKVAEIAGLSSKYFSKLFRLQYNKTYKKYLFEAKMNYAKFLLEETDYTIKQIAILLGYSDQYIFSNQFKRIQKMSPSKVKHQRDSFPFIIK